ncbi:ATP-dependent RNA helicase HrpA [Zooshikella ganghwensis]|uniref:ATP-dependent RNA helicase HrpA n=1 Tax=Zooshikella ganghwensis TaxID=202772 RepID=UPI002D7F5666|nr:ATP-dependent RNA helicase HrpA [Zooshikella ganghwensis]
MITFAVLKEQISQAMLKDRFRFNKRLNHLRKTYRGKKIPNEALIAIQDQVAKSTALVQLRKANSPKPTYNEQLPIAQKRAEILDAFKQHQVIVVAGETGSGKTTQLPKICLEAGQGILGMIGHTQPRRLAARSVASRIAEELQTQLGDAVGYQVRFTDQVSDQTHIKLMTDGILLAEIQQDRFLNQYDTLIIDEAHERSLNIDFLLGYLKWLLPKRPELKLIITSATIDVERFSQHFNQAPIIEVSGRAYPVTVHYRPFLDNEEDSSDNKRDTDEKQLQGIISALREIEQLERQGQVPRLGDVLVFLSGEREIRDTAKALRQAAFRDTEVLPLYARLTAAEQQRVFQPHRGRRVVLATNVAETSITVPGIRYVIDPGTARVSRYSYRSKVQRLPIEAVSQASANQRKGRCGRVAEGVCFRLFSEEDFLGRPEFTEPEIQRTNLASVILKMLQMRLGDITAFPFVDPPDNRLINDGLKLLQELQAIDHRQRLTPLGRQLAQLPVDPRMGRMLVAGAGLQALREVLIIASALSIQDPRERPTEKQQAADQQHAQFKHDDSDFLSFVQLWDAYENQRQELSQNQLRKYCKQHFLSYLRMREWRDLHHQLMLACRQLGLKINQEPAEYAAVHQALVPGLLGNIGTKLEQGEYQGARNKKFYLFPGSALFKRQPKWVMSAELVETSKLYGRILGKIEPEWVEKAAEHLLKRHYFEPHWEKRRGQVIAFEQVTLYGLIVVPRRKIDYRKIDPVVARQLFIRGALVEGNFTTQGDFFEYNQLQIDAVENLEAKARRRDILVDEEVLYQFYDERIPHHIADARSFERWRKTQEKKDPDYLLLTQEYLMRHEAEHITAEQYPDQFAWQGVHYPLSYHFDPTADDDGVTLQVPVAALPQLPRNRLQWLVPGLIEEKCTALIRGLPKAVRKNFVPVPDFVNAALEAISPDDTPLTEKLGEQLRKMTGIRVSEEEWQQVKLAAHLQMNIHVVDEQGRSLGQGRDLQALLQQFADVAEASLKQLSNHGLERNGITQWNFDYLPEEITQQQQGLVIRGYPALVDEKNSVALKVFATEDKAKAEHHRGVTRLALLALPSQQLKYLRTQMPQLKQVALWGVNVYPKSLLEEDIIWLAVNTLLHDEETEPPRNEADFLVLIEKLRGNLASLVSEITALLVDVFSRYHAINKQLKGRISLAVARSLADIKFQLQQLVYRGCLRDVPLCWLRHYPRYLDAILQRLDKLGGQIPRDNAHTEELTQLWEAYQQRASALQGASLACPHLQLYRWLLEEYRVSLFAQSLKTSVPISAKRLRKQWELVLQP